jgi:hypothetical protein
MSQFDSVATGKVEGTSSNKTRGTSPATVLLGIVLQLYVASVFVAVPYYNWEYAREHGFTDWLVWGEIVPTGKAFAWPYYAMHRSKPLEEKSAIVPLSQRQINRMNIMSADRAIASAQQATYVTNTREQGSALTSEQKRKVIEYSTEALESGDATDEEALNKIYPEFGTRFKRDFCGSLRFFVSGLRTGSINDLAKSNELDHAWGQWANENRKQIAAAMNLAPQ